MWQSPAKSQRTERNVNNPDSKLRNEAQKRSYGASDLCSYSSVDLSSMIASWVDRNSCSEYETELKVSAGKDFKAIAMKKRNSEANIDELQSRQDETMQSLPGVQCSSKEGSVHSISYINSWPRSTKRHCSSEASSTPDFLRSKTDYLPIILDPIGLSPPDIPLTPDPFNPWPLTPDHHTSHSQEYVPLLRRS